MSQYYTITTITTGTNTGTNKYQTVALTANTVSTSTAVTSRRIMITNGASPAFVAFGAAPSSTLSTGFQLPANSEMIFNFRSGDKVAAISASNSAISILDLD
jgi:hypothetical protein